MRTICDASGLSPIGLFVSLQSLLTGQAIASVRNHNPECGTFLTGGRASFPLMEDHVAANSPRPHLSRHSPLNRVVPEGTPIGALGSPGKGGALSLRKSDVGNDASSAVIGPHRPAILVGVPEAGGFQSGKQNDRHDS